MQRSKSRRHQVAARARWANAERAAGIVDREPAFDCRRPIRLDLTSAGGPDLTLEPRLGYVAWRARDAASGEVLRCAALKELLHSIADDLPRMLGARASS